MLRIKLVCRTNERVACVLRTKEAQQTYEKHAHRFAHILPLSSNMVMCAMPLPHRMKADVKYNVRQNRVMGSIFRVFAIFTWKIVLYSQFVKLACGKNTPYKRHPRSPSAKYPLKCKKKSKFEWFKTIVIISSHESAHLAMLCWDNAYHFAITRTHENTAATVRKWNFDTL